MRVRLSSECYTVESSTMILNNMNTTKNGRLTRDRNKNILQIQYNLLNLPSKTTFGDGGYINYQYSASGMKQMVWGSAPGQGSKSQFYLGNYVYSNGVKQLLVDGGYVTFSGTTPQYHFYVKDHLGNNRMVVNASGTVEQVSHYYAFGGLMGENTGSDVQDFKYNGKELDRLHGLDWFDYGARHYDGVIGSWPTMDPLCEKYYNISPYAYCANNPVNRVDPDGRDWYQNEETHYYTWYNGNNNREGFIYIGGKGSVLGEFEDIIDNVLSGKDGLGMESLYSEGFTFDIAPNDKGGLIGSKDGGGNFFDEFVNGTGPEFSVLLGDHPYTETLKNESFVKRSQNIILSRGKNGKYTNAGRP